ncbi:hypothetical protein BCR42DRAFT_467591 [Absidia repens]|uniref:Uncharacterized protein n=1 Tax=Absidia repens TaxID=90262 RepID=A0A1X2IAZ2_9FUNG|nr:hypothetical protein BCR42DRAFT_467591 [Absidia repens]
MAQIFITDPHLLPFLVSVNHKPIMLDRYYSNTVLIYENWMNAPRLDNGYGIELVPSHWTMLGYDGKAKEYDKNACGRIIKCFLFCRNKDFCRWPYCGRCDRHDGLLEPPMKIDGKKQQQGSTVPRSLHQDEENLQWHTIIKNGRWYTKDNDNVESAYGRIKDMFVWVDVGDHFGLAWLI